MRLIKIRNHYDWVVLGDNPGTILSACLASRLGFSVLILPLSPGKKLSYSSLDQCLDPEPNSLIGLGQVEGQAGLVATCLNEMDLVEPEKERIILDNILPQIVTPKFRISLNQEENIFFHELKRELGETTLNKMGLVGALKKSDGLTLNYWNHLPDRLSLDAKPETFKDELVTYSQLRQLLSRASNKAQKNEKFWFNPGNHLSTLVTRFKDPELKPLFRGLWYGITEEISKNPSLIEILHFLSLAKTSASFKGGMSSYRALLFALARRLGAHVPLKHRCRRIFIEDGKFTGVQLEGFGKMITTSGGVIGCALNHVKDQIHITGAKGQPKLKSSPKPIGWRFTISILINNKGIPPGIASRLIWQEPKAPVLEIEIADTKYYGVEEEDRSYLFLRTILPFKKKSFTPAEQRMVAARMFRKLTELFPFIEEHVKWIYPDFRSNDDEFQEVFGFSELEEIPENIRIIPAGAGIGFRSGVENLFLATSESYPEFGSLGSNIAALESVAWLAHRRGVSGPLK